MLSEKSMQKYDKIEEFIGQEFQKYNCGYEIDPILFELFVNLNDMCKELEKSYLFYKRRTQEIHDRCSRSSCN